MPKLWRKKKKTFRAAIETSFTLVAAIGQASPDPVVGTVLTFIVKVKEEVDKVVAYKVCPRFNVQIHVLYLIRNV